jgi:hypothetical protein
VPFSTYALDKYFAQDLSNLSACTAPDLSAEFDQAEHWVGNFILNSMFTMSVKSEFRPHMFGILRRAQMALVEYENGRKALLDYLQRSKEATSRYFRALYHFEIAIALAYQANVFYCKITGEKMYRDGDGSPLYRLARIYNISKHLEEATLTPDQLHHVWLTDNGIRTAPVELRWEEFAEILKGIGLLADTVSRGGNK